MKNTSKQNFFLDFLIDFFFFVEKICHETFQKTCFREKKTTTYLVGSARDCPPRTLKVDVIVWFLGWCPRPNQDPKKCQKYVICHI